MRSDSTSVVDRFCRAAAATFAVALVAASASAAGRPPPGRIAFALDRGDISSIWTVRPDGSGLRQVTRPFVRQGFGGDSGPVWSADGRKLAFARDLPYWGSDRYRVHVVGSTGRGDDEVTAGPFDVMPSWSASGRRLAFVRLVVGDEVTLSTIYVVAPGGSAKKLVAGSRDVTPAWSPDGRWIAFARLLGSRAELYVAAADGSGVRDLGVAGTQPAWSPDSQHLAFVSYADGYGATCGGGGCMTNGELYTVRSDGSEPTRLTHSKADDAHPSWSPDGRSIVFSSGYELASSGHRPWLMVVGAAGGRPTRLTRLVGIHDPAWSPATVH